MNTLNKSQRNYGIDLLRMFAMFLIAVLHVLGQGGVIGAIGDNALNYQAAWLLEIGAYCCVNCYALISGYVGLNTKFKYTNIIMLWFNVFFYTVGITLIFQFVMPEALITDNPDGKFFLISERWENAVFPVTSQQYWYFTAYFLCYFFTPVLNKAVQALEKKQIRNTIIALLLIYSVPPLFTGKDVFGGGFGYSAIWLIVLYLTGAYMKKYNSLSYLKAIPALLGYIASVSFTWAVKIGIENFIPQFKRSNLLVNYTSPTIIAAAIFLLIFFKNLKLPNIACKIIKFMSPLAFSVYIIHVQPLIWQNIVKGLFKEIAKFPMPLMVISVIGASLGLYLVCSAIDVVRFYLFKLIRLQKLVFFLETKIREKLSKKENETEKIDEKETINV